MFAPVLAVPAHMPSAVVTADEAGTQAMTPSAPDPSGIQPFAIMLDRIVRSVVYR